MGKFILAIASCFAAIVFSSLACYGKGKVFERSDIFDNMRPGDRAAILMIHFGTTHDDTRKVTIDAINEKVRSVFNGVEVREAYSSRIVIKRLSERGVLKENPEEALKRLKLEGYTHVLIQPTTIIDGVEMESVNRDAENFSKSFSEIRVGLPMLYTPEDYKRVIEILTVGTERDCAYLLVGHGSYDPSTAQYAMLDYMFKSEGYNNFFVGTIEGYPSEEDAIKQLRLSAIKKVVLVPFMFVAGEHAKNDISEDWYKRLEEEGYEVVTKMEGLGEIPQIQDLFIEHLRFISQNRKIGIMEKKEIYKQTGEVMQ